MDQKICEDLKKLWIAEMNRLRVDIPFFTWLELFANCSGLKGNIFTLPSVNVQTSLYKTWHLVDGCT